jgi:metal-responsive CopG/Arc/MetJ family transcriptional regulator
MAFDTTKETMVSFLVPSQILETIEDIRDVEGNPSRSSIIRRLLNRGLKSYYDNDTQQRHLNKPR